MSRVLDTVLDFINSVNATIYNLPFICEASNSTSVPLNPEQSIAFMIPFYLACIWNCSILVAILYDHYVQFKSSNLTNTDIIKLNEVACCSIATVLLIFGSVFYRNKAVCSVLSVALWYTYLVTFMLVLMSGIRMNLALSGNYYFNTRPNWIINLRNFLLSAYLIPVAIVLLSFILLIFIEFGKKLEFNWQHLLQPLRDKKCCVIAFPQFSGYTWIFKCQVILPMLIHTLNHIRIIHIYNKLEDRQASLSLSNSRQAYKCVWFFCFFYSCVCPWSLSIIVLLSTYQFSNIIGYFIFYNYVLLQNVVFREIFFFKPRPSDVDVLSIDFIRNKLNIKCAFNKNDIFVQKFTEDEIGADEEYGENGVDADTYSTASIIPISYISTGMKQNTNTIENVSFSSS